MLKPVQLLQVKAAQTFNKRQLTTFTDGIKVPCIHTKVLKVLILR